VSMLSTLLVTASWVDDNRPRGAFSSQRVSADHVKHHNNSAFTLMFCILILQTTRLLPHEDYQPHSKIISVSKRCAESPSSSPVYLSLQDRRSLVDTFFPHNPIEGVVPKRPRCFRRCDGLCPPYICSSLDNLQVLLTTQLDGE
jgi:hypothetical protein